MRVLVAGWYGHHNLGDEAFRPAMQTVLGDEADLTFTDHVPEDVNDWDALVFGGGSFLDQPMPVQARAIEIPVGFLGVGIHGVIDSSYMPFLANASVIVTRNRVNLDVENVHQAPDLLFAREDLFQTPERFLPDVSEGARRRMLVLPNGFTGAQATSPSWKVRSSDWFELALGDVLADYAAEGWTASIQPMLAAGVHVLVAHDDRVAAMRLMNRDFDGKVFAGTRPLSEAELVEEIDRADLVVSARFHGCVLAAMAGVPFVGISPHAKVQSFFDENGWANYVSFFGFSPEEFARALAAQPSPDQMHQVREKGKARWAELAAIVRESLFT